MKLIADSGSTKTAWYLLNNQQITRYETIGYNPLILSTTEIQASLVKNLLPVLKKSKSLLKTLFFYGAGCSSPAMQEEMQAVFKSLFPQAEVVVKGDLWACIYATCGNQPGLCAILGTGSNACLYDGAKISSQRPSLGYLLADEGGGVSIGRHLLQDYFYQKMPQKLQKAFHEQYSLEVDAFVKKLYDHKRPNQFLASFAIFAANFRNESYIQQLLQKIFLNFIQIHLLHLNPEREHPVHFVGTIATVFQDELEQILRQNHFSVGTIIKTPFPKLLDYHQSNSN